MTTSCCARPGAAAIRSAGKTREPDELRGGRDVVAAPRRRSSRAGRAASGESGANRGPPSWGTWPVGLRTIRLARGVGAVDAPAERVAGQRGEVERGVVAAEAEPEAPLAVDVAVAGPHVAAGLREQRGHVEPVARPAAAAPGRATSTATSADRPAGLDHGAGPCPSAAGRDDARRRDRRRRPAARPRTGPRRSGRGPSRRRERP